MPKGFDYLCCKCGFVCNKKKCSQPNGCYKCWNCQHYACKFCTGK